MITELDLAKIEESRSFILIWLVKSVLEGICCCRCFVSKFVIRLELLNGSSFTMKGSLAVECF